MYRQDKLVCPLATPYGSENNTQCCAGLTRTRFAELSDDNMLFYCPSFASDKHTHELAELKSTVAALVLEVEQLKSSVHTLSSTVYPAEGDERTWSQVVQKKRKSKVLTRVRRNGLGNGPVSATNDSPELENAVGALTSKLHLPKRKKSLVQGEFGEP